MVAPTAPPPTQRAKLHRVSGDETEKIRPTTTHMIVGIARCA
jgi:hypothetical protein